MRYVIIVEKGRTSFGAYAPALPRCIAVAKTCTEVLHLRQEAIEFHPQSLQEDGLPIPEPTSSSEYVEVDAA